MLKKIVSGVLVLCALCSTAVLNVSAKPVTTMVGVTTVVNQSGRKQKAMLFTEEQNDQVVTVVNLIQKQDWDGAKEQNPDLASFFLELLCRVPNVYCHDPGRSKIGIGGDSDFRVEKTSAMVYVELLEGSVTMYLIKLVYNEGRSTSTYKFDSNAKTLEDVARTF
ncbi:MAG: hypothetical protein LBJ83_03250 [Oscillospiraceae bacterium]|jgi:hypothetical protein|nr:hypothetical protein [Oscillospiraceae bacterium]